MAVHRIIEANAAKLGDIPAIAGAGITISYRELNQRANAVARHLLAQGLRRGTVATVCLPCDAETVVVLPVVAPPVPPARAQNRFPSVGPGVAVMVRCT